MVKRHLKRLNAPKTWDIARRGIRFTTKSNPGGLKKDLTLPVATVLKYMLKLTGTIKETKHAVTCEEILINGVKINDYRYPVGFTDIVTITKTGAHYRLIVDRDAKLTLIPITKEEAGLKLIKIIGKRMVKGKLQLNLLDGRNVFFEKQHYKVGDSLLLTIPGNIVKEHLAFEKGALILLYRGKHIGRIGTLKNVTEKSITVQEGEHLFETKKDYALVVGKDKPLVKMTK